MSEPRVPPRPTADWNAEVFDALSVLRPPGTAGLTPEQQERASRRPPSNLVGVLAWHPALTKAFLAFSNHLFRSTLPDRPARWSRCASPGCGGANTSGRST